MGLLVSAAFVESFSGDTTLIPFNFIEGFQNSSVSKVTGYGLDDRGRILIFTTTSRSALGPIQWLPGTLSLGLKLPERETDDLIPSGAEFKNAWSFSLRSSSTLRSRWSQGDFYNFAAIVSTHDNVNVRLTAL